MDQQAFYEAVLHAVNLKLPSGHTAHFRKVDKTNDVSYTAMYLTVSGQRVSSPVIYMEPILKGRTEEEIEPLAQGLARALLTPPPDEATIERVMDPEYVRTHLVYRLIHEQRNRARLRECPHRIFLDLAIVYAVYLSDGIAGTGLTAVTNDLQRQLGFSEEELYAFASENTPRLMPERILDLCRAAGQEQMPAGEQFLVLSNEASFYGAAALLYSKQIRAAAEYFEDDLFILPSSVHELIVLPASARDPRELERVLTNVLSDSDQPENFLSDHLYRYLRASEEFVSVPRSLTGNQHASD